MGLNLNQLFVRDFDVDRFSRAVIPLWSRAVAGDREHPLRQLAILQTGTPWTVFVDSTSLVSRELAGELSAKCGGQSVWMSVGSTMLGYNFCKVVEGETVIDRSVPAKDSEGLMPLYVDAEQEAWRLMADLGIPARYRFLRLRDVDYDDVEKGQRGDMIFLQRPALGEPVGHMTMRQKIRRPPEGMDGPPTEYSIWKEGSNVLYDLYLVGGRPTDERIDHLLMTFDAIARRKPRPEGYSYRPVVTAMSGDAGESEKVRQHLLQRFNVLSKDRAFAFQF